MQRHTTIAMLAASLTLGAGVGSAATFDQPQKPRERACFDRDLWSGDSGDRPCVRVLRVAEDASFKVRIGPADTSGGHRVWIGNPLD